MGYLDSRTVTVDAILTKHGRKLLAQGQGLGISYFALSDDGIDYSLWNTGHPSGSAYYGEAIENLPMLEAVPDDSVLMRYKLITLDRNTIYMPLVRVVSPLTLETQSDSKSIGPSTENGSDSGYVFYFTDISAVNVTGGTRRDVSGVTNQMIARQDIQNSAAFTGKSITLSPKVTGVAKTIQVRVTGLDTGAVAYVDVTIQKNQRTLGSL